MESLSAGIGRKIVDGASLVRKEFSFFFFFFRRSVLDTYKLKCSFDIQVEMTSRRSNT